MQTRDKFDLQKVIELTEQRSKLFWQRVNEGRAEQETWSRGYWWVEQDENAQSIDRKLLAQADVATGIEGLVRAPEARQRAAVAELLGWMAEPGRAEAFLYELLDDSDDSVRNAAARALLPLVLSGKAEFRSEAFAKLFERGEPLRVNKALGFLCYLWDSGRASRVHDFLTPERLLLIEGYAASEVALLSKPARQLLDKLADL
jgi:hypothetical protein